MNSRAGVPDEMAVIVTASIVFFVGAYYLVEWLFEKFGYKRAQGPHSAEIEGGKNNECDRDFTILVTSSLMYSAPLIFTAIAGAFSERSGCKYWFRRNYGDGRFFICHI